ncbi:MAG: hypothetical protein Q8N88_02065 [Nanoarchaeota archaeon]|nr:hypothetical protein [Nanoarchaeota archaeon]
MSKKLILFIIAIIVIAGIGYWVYQLRKPCVNTCGDGKCAEIVCLAIGCPCSETKASCPQDCK